MTARPSTATNNAGNIRVDAADLVCVIVFISFSPYRHTRRLYKLCLAWQVSWLADRGLCTCLPRPSLDKWHRRYKAHRVQSRGRLWRGADAFTKFPFQFHTLTKAFLRNTRPLQLRLIPSQTQGDLRHHRAKRRNFSLVRSAFLDHNRVYAPEPNHIGDSLIPQRFGPF